MLRERVGVALSGGVDSSVAAYLLKESGCELHGMFMRTWNADDSLYPLSMCPWRQDLEDARSVAEQLGIEFEVVNMIDRYRELVVKDLVDGYRNGVTPNPDVLCNQRVKFGALLKHAQGLGCTKIATGHYCRRVDNPDGTSDIFEGADKNKDQSYFLALLSQQQVQQAVFPIGKYDKPDVRSIANRLGLKTANKKDSQGICFLGKVKVQDFLAQYIEEIPGEIVTSDGQIIGEHHGLFRFTIGQRHGINIPSNRDNKHYVVVGKDLKKNRLIVEIEDPNSNLLYANEFRIRGLSFTNKPIQDNASILAKPRYRDPSQKITFQYIDSKTALVRFETAQRALSSGQIIAFYDQERLLGGGIYV